MKNYRKIFLMGIFALIIAISPLSHVKALTESELKAQISSIQAQIAQLQGQLQSQSATSTWCHTFNTNLAMGDDNSETSYLRYALSRENLINMLSNIDENNYFDSEVNSAVIKFQEKYASEVLYPSGLKKGTGFVGSATRSKLNKLYGCKSTNNTANTQTSNNSTTSNAPLAITSVSGPTSLNMGQQETWTVNTNNSGQLSYAVSWGDESFLDSYFNTGQTFVSSPVFTHTFSNSGSYAVKFTAKDSKGNTTSTSINVNISNPNQQSTSNTNTSNTNTSNTNTDSSTNQTSNTSSTPPTITSITGPTSLNINQQGTWTVNTNNPSGGQLSYSTSLGDESFFDSYFNIGQTFVSSPVSTHTYPNTGTYYLKFTVKDSNGKTTSTSINVNVINPNQQSSSSNTNTNSNSNTSTNTNTNTSTNNQTSSQSNTPPSITGISGPTSLNIGQTGTWTVGTNNPGGSQLSYTVIWEDELFFESYFTNGQQIFINSPVFSHYYQTAGIYYPIFTVKNNVGNVVSKSIAVKVIDPNIIQNNYNYPYYDSNSNQYYDSNQQTLDNGQNQIQQISGVINMITQMIGGGLGGLGGGLGGLLGGFGGGLGGFGF